MVDDERELEVVSSTATASAICKECYNIKQVEPNSCYLVTPQKAKNRTLSMGKEKGLRKHMEI